jgi:hypothetical protein
MNSTTVLSANTLLLSSTFTAMLTTTKKSKKTEKKDKGYEVSRRMEGGIVVSRVDGKKVEVEVAS